MDFVKNTTFIPGRFPAKALAVGLRLGHEKLLQSAIRPAAVMQLAIAPGAPVSAYFDQPRSRLIYPLNCCPHGVSFFF
jgi:hypothetical protein